jgi:hypothetical protein
MLGFQFLTHRFCIFPTLFCILTLLLFLTQAQVDRYKQLLLKQRDIMIQLTARLNERDQSILVLQEELDTYVVCA